MQLFIAMLNWVIVCWLSFSFSASAAISSNFWRVSNPSRFISTGIFLNNEAGVSASAAMPDALAVLATAAAQPQQMVWHFSSSEAAGNLRQLGSRSGPDATVNAPDWSRSVALATHPRIAEAVRQLGFARVEPLDVGLDAVVAWWRRHVPVG